MNHRAVQNTVPLDARHMNLGKALRAKLQERIMDSNAQESERGITILAKNTSVR